MEQILHLYYENNAKKLHNIVDQLLAKFGGVADKDYSDFYSIANEVFVDVIKRYDGKQSFAGFLYSCLRNKFKTELTARNRQKRIAERYMVSLDTPLEDQEYVTIGDRIPSDFDIEAEIFKESNAFADERIGAYFNQLSKIQQQILTMRMEEMPISKIKAQLQLSNKLYEQHWQKIRSFANIAILYRKENKDYEEESNMNQVSTQTMENCKTDKISIASIIKKIDRHTIRFDHPLQRESDQWSPTMKGNLISDILQGNKFHPLIFAEQIINGVPIIWDLDGKQRCTNVYSFSKNGYKISKNIRRWRVTYQTTQKDEEGKELLDEDGFPIVRNDEFDIRGKRFADLPEELQDRFLEYNFNYDQYLNCSELDIGYHIERYNDGKPMTSSQKGITKLGTEYAEMIKAISNMPFFKNMGSYKPSEFKNGTVNRVVIESIMAVYFLDHWKKDQDDMCRYIREHATLAEFEDFEDMVIRLEKAMTESSPILYQGNSFDVADMFDSKDSFLWFGLFAVFLRTGLKDHRFLEFMAEFSYTLHRKRVGKITYDELCINTKTGKTRSTKDKYIVVPKMELLKKLLFSYLQIESREIEERNKKQPVQARILEFIREKVKKDVKEEDLALYQDLLDSYLKVDSPLYKEENLPSLLSIVAYGCEQDKDVELETWFQDFGKRNKSYKKNQTQNYLYMKTDFEKTM